MNKRLVHAVIIRRDAGYSGKLLDLNVVLFRKCGHHLCAACTFKVHSHEMQVKANDIFLSYLSSLHVISIIVINSTHLLAISLSRSQGVNGPLKGIIPTCCKSVGTSFPFMNNSFLISISVEGFPPSTSFALGDPLTYRSLLGATAPSLFVADIFGLMVEFGLVSGGGGGGGGGGSGGLGRTLPSLEQEDAGSAVEQK